MKISKLLTSVIALTPIVAFVPSISSCNKNTQIGSAEEYIKDRTFAIAGFDYQGDLTAAGTGWILSDATPDILDDYQYYIATNWHVEYGMEEITPTYNLGYRTDDFTKGYYVPFESYSWETDKNNFCYDKGNTKTAIDFYVVKVNFGIAEGLPATTKTQLDKLNAKQKADKCINKFAKSTTTSNFSNKQMYCGGYPTVDRYQTWKFESLKSGFTTHTDKVSTYTDGHYIDGQSAATAKIWDISPQYQTNADNVFLCKKDSTGEYVPINWSLISGSSGSMLITKENNEWVIVGIYWGGAIYTVGESTDRWFSPCWSIFNSNHKDFSTPYLK